MDATIDEELHQESGQILLSIIRGEKVDKQVARVAMTSYSGSTRAMSTARVKDAMQYTIIKDLANNKSELDKYVKATLPDFIPTKQLT